MARGESEIFVGGQTRVVRYRAREIRELEKRLSVPLVKILNEQLFGFDFLVHALFVGVAHDFVGKKGSEALTEKKVERWIDESPDWSALLGEVIQAFSEALDTSSQEGDTPLD